MAMTMTTMVDPATWWTAAGAGAWTAWGPWTVHTGDVQTTALLGIVKTVLLLLGGLITYLAYAGYRDTGEGTMLYLAAGFGLVTFAILLQGIFFELVGLGLAAADLLATLVAIAGFATILVSLYR